MNKLTLALCWAGLGALVGIGPAQANTLVIADQIEAVSGGSTNFDTWKFNIQATGTFDVDVLAYEATQKNVATAGYQTVDVNGDGELTWLDTDTQWWRDDGALDSTDGIIRCDDLGANCPKYAGATSLNSSTEVAGLPISLVSHLLTETSADGSVFLRDPWYSITFSQTGNYLLLIGQYFLNYDEIVNTKLNANTNAFSPPSGFGASVTDHADYQIIFSSDSLVFSRDGDTITVSAVPIPGAIWLFASACAGLLGLNVRRRG